MTDGRTSAEGLVLAARPAQSGIAGPLTRSTFEERCICMALRILRERVSHADVLTSPWVVKDFLTVRYSAQQHESFSVVFVDASNRVISVEEMFRGTLSQTSVYPREVARRVLELNAAAVILAHNHPSGTVQPSRADEALTQAIKSALALFDVRVLDHIIVGGATAHSMAECGQL